jgi:FtsP/CotA-like multicopper oxidase with cupredoxin domain
MPDTMDATALRSVPGAQFRYEFEVDNRAGSWFHPHPHGRTGNRCMPAWRGCSWSVTIWKPPGLPGGAFDLPLVIQDRLIDDDNQFVHPTGGPTLSRRGAGGMGQGMGGGMMGRAWVWAAAA